jgi:hypothetical protein
MGVPTLEVCYTSATTGRGDHEVHKGHVVALERKKRKLTPWSRVLLEKLTGAELVKEFQAVLGSRRFITSFTSAGHLSLS